MLIKTSKLTGQQLNWAVAKCEGHVLERDEGADVSGLAMEQWHYEPSTNWSQGGPIIERERIELFNTIEPYEYGASYCRRGRPAILVWGNTYLIAAMRCYVASKLGDEVDIPDQLT